MKPYLQAVSKAIAAALGGFLAAAGTAMIDGDVTRPEVIAAAGLGLLGGFGTYAAPANLTRPPRPPRSPGAGQP